jgi:hypothetical protein
MVARTVLAAEKVSTIDEQATRPPVVGQVKIGGYDTALMAKIALMVDKVCCAFASVVDWQYRPVSVTSSHRKGSDHGVMGFVVTENHEALRAGGYIKINAVPTANLLRVRAGCYDTYFNPVTVCERNVALSGLNQQKLESLLNETYEKLTTYYIRRVS